MNWPIYFNDNLIKGNEKSCVAICTLWLKKDLIAKELNPKDYSIIGNLYSKDGINYILRNVLSNPKIRFIILCGYDRSESGKALLNLKRYGINDDHVINKSGFQLEKEIDISAINLFREKVEVIDLSEQRNPEHIKNKLSQITNNLPPFLEEPLIFPEPKITCETFPSEGKAIVVRGNLIAEVWVKLLDHILKFGLYDKTQYTVEQKEIIDLVSVISKEDPEDIYFPSWLPFKETELEGSTQKELGGNKKRNLTKQAYFPFVKFVGDEPHKGYYAQVLTDHQLPDLSYTYGQRLLRFNGINQIEDIIDKLNAAKYSRRAIAVLWNPLIDSKSENPPCLTLVQFRIVENKLLLTVYFRSHDIYGAWSKNAFALRKLQKLIADELQGIVLGDLIIVSHSAHIYKNDYNKAENIVKKQFLKIEKKLKFERDPRGSFAIRVENKKIIVNHYSPDGKHIQTFSGINTNELNQQMSTYISLVSHAIYLGKELEKAEIALKLEIPYIQDKQLKLLQSQTNMHRKNNHNQKVSNEKRTAIKSC